MTNDEESQDSLGSKAINVDADCEVEAWSARLGVSREQLLGAINAIGPMSAAVEFYLRKKRRSTHGLTSK